MFPTKLIDKPQKGFASGSEYFGVWSLLSGFSHDPRAPSIFLLRCSTNKSDRLIVSRAFLQCCYFPCSFFWDVCVCLVRSLAKSHFYRSVATDGVIYTPLKGEKERERKSGSLELLKLGRVMWIWNRSYLINVFQASRTGEFSARVRPPLCSHSLSRLNRPFFTLPLFVSRLPCTSSSIVSLPDPTLIVFLSDIHISLRLGPSLSLFVHIFY